MQVHYGKETRHQTFQNKRNSPKTSNTVDVAGIADKMNDFAPLDKEAYLPVPTPHTAHNPSWPKTPAHIFESLSRTKDERNSQDKTATTGETHRACVHASTMQESHPDQRCDILYQFNTRLFADCLIRMSGTQIVENFDNLDQFIHEEEKYLKPLFMQVMFPQRALGEEELLKENSKKSAL